MNYLVIKDNTITQVCTSIEDLLKYLEVKVTDEGVIEITNDGRQLPTTYNMKEFTKENEGQVKTFMDGAESLDNTIFFGMTNYIDKIPSSIKNRPSRFKYCIEIEGIQSEKEIKIILDKMIGDIYEDEVIIKFSTDLKGNTLDQIKQFCIDKIMDISSTPITKKKIGFK